MGLWRLLSTEAARLILEVSLQDENLSSSALTIDKTHKRKKKNLGCDSTTLECDDPALYLCSLTGLKNAVQTGICKTRFMFFCNLPNEENVLKCVQQMPDSI